MKKVLTKRLFIMVLSVIVAVAMVVPMTPGTYVYADKIDPSTCTLDIRNSLSNPITSFKITEGQSLNCMLTKYGTRYSGTMTFVIQKYEDGVWQDAETINDVVVTEYDNSFLYINLQHQPTGYSYVNLSVGKYKAVAMYSGDDYYNPITSNWYEFEILPHNNIVVDFYLSEHGSKLDELMPYFFDKKVTYSEAYGSLPTPTKTGYTFDGWYHYAYDSAIGKTVVTEKTADTIVGRDWSTNDRIILYAHWTPNTHAITLNPNSGKSSKPEISVTVGSTIPTLPKATRKGYTFKGWFTAKSGGVQVKKGDVVTDKIAKTLYAQWKKVTVGKASIKKVKNMKKKEVNVTIKNVNGATGYQVVYSKNKNFKKSKKDFTVKPKKTLEKLTKNKKYYIKVRAYKIDSTGAKVYGKYSKVKTIKIKK